MSALGLHVRDRDLDPLLLRLDLGHDLSRFRPNYPMGVGRALVGLVGEVLRKPTGGLTHVQMADESSYPLTCRSPREGHHTAEVDLDEATLVLERVQGRMAVADEAIEAGVLEPR